MESLRAQGSSSLYRSIRPILAGKKDGARNLPTATPEEMNRLFVNVGPRIAASLAGLGRPPDVPCRLPRVGACGYRVAGTTLDGLPEVIFSMKRSGACGSDDICIRILILCFDAIGPILLHIVNTCLITCDIPEANEAETFPGPPNLQVRTFNYRPISIVPIMTNIVERVMLRQLFDYMSRNHLLSSSQHGFRPGIPLKLLCSPSPTASFPTWPVGGHVSLLCLLDISKQVL